MESSDEEVLAEQPEFRTYLLEANGKQTIPITSAALGQCKTLAPKIHDNQWIFPVDTDFKTLQRIVEWCEHHKDEMEITESEKNSSNKRELPEWDKEFLKVDGSELHQLISAAHALDIDRLLWYCCKVVAGMTRGKTAHEMMIMFGISTDEEDQEEAEMRIKIE